MCAILATVLLVVTLYCAGIGSPTGEVLYRAAPGVLSAAQSGVNQYLAPWIWEQFANGVLAQPAWTLPAGLTVIFALIAVLPERIGATRPAPLAAAALERPHPAQNGSPPGAPRV